MCVPVNASELGHALKLKTALIPRRASSARDRASEVVQRTAGFVLKDADTMVTPSAPGHVFIVEKIEGDRWLVSDMNEGLRGWIQAGSAVPLAKAEKFFNHQVELNPKDEFALLMRGVVRYEHDDIEGAAADLDAAIAINPKYVPALLTRACIWQWRNRLDDAIADASKAIAFDPQNSDAFVERGIFEYTRKEYDEALRDFQAAVDLGSHSAVIYIARGLIFLTRHEPNKAFAELRRAQAMDPRHPDAYSALAGVFLMQGNKDKALKVLDQAVEIDPQCADSHGNRAVVLLTMGKFDKALEDLNEVLRIAPSSARAFRERAWILATCPDPQVRNGELAVRSGTKACELTDWKEPRSLATLAAACSEAGDFEGAVKWQQMAFELVAATNPDKQEHLRLLERYKAKKPYHRLGLLQEMGVPESKAVAK